MNRSIITLHHYNSAPSGAGTLKLSSVFNYLSVSGAWGFLFLQNLARNRKILKFIFYPAFLDFYGELYFSLHLAKTENLE